MADRERIERIAAMIYAQLVTREGNENLCSQDATDAIYRTEVFIDVFDEYYKPEQPETPPHDSPTLLEAAKNFLRNVLLVGATPLAQEYARQLRAAVEREEAQHKETP